MGRELLKLLLNQNIEYLCELYQFAQQKYFTAYIDDDKDGMNYYKEIINSIEQELRIRNYWKYYFQ